MVIECFEIEIFSKAVELSERSFIDSILGRGLIPRQLGWIAATVQAELALPLPVQHRR